MILVRPYFYEKVHTRELALLLFILKYVIVFLCYDDANNEINVTVIVAVLHLMLIKICSAVEFTIVSRTTEGALTFCQTMNSKWIHLKI